MKTEMMYKGHKIEIEDFGVEKVFYDGKEVSSSMRRSSPHIFQVSEDGEEIQYEVTISSGWRSPWCCEVKRKGEIVFTDRKGTNRKGLTLKNLLIVAFIAGILAAIAVPRFRTYEDTIKDKLAVPLRGLDTLIPAIVGYYQSHQSFKPADTLDEIRQTYGVTPTGWDYTVDGNGVITAKGRILGKRLDTITMKPNVDPNTGRITWNLTASGGISGVMMGILWKHLNFPPDLTYEIKEVILR